MATLPVTDLPFHLLGLRRKTLVGKDFRWVFAVVFLILRHGWADTQSCERRTVPNARGVGASRAALYLNNSTLPDNAVIAEVESSEKAVRFRDLS